MEFNRIAAYFYLNNRSNKIHYYCKLNSAWKVILKKGFAEIRVIRA